jgi:hypothetical protein
MKTHKTILVAAGKAVCWSGFSENISRHLGTGDETQAAHVDHLINVDPEIRAGADEAVGVGW